MRSPHRWGVPFNAHIHRWGDRCIDRFSRARRGTHARQGIRFQNDDGSHRIVVFGSALLRTMMLTTTTMMTARPTATHAARHATAARAAAVRPTTARPVRMGCAHVMTLGDALIDLD